MQNSGEIPCLKIVTASNLKLLIQNDKRLAIKSALNKYVKIQLNLNLAIHCFLFLEERSRGFNFDEVLKCCQIMSRH